MTLFFLLLLPFASLFSHEFIGQHYLGEYYECSSVLEDSGHVWGAMLRACDLAGANIIKSEISHFPGGGFTILITLSESHASIHTYPEYSACFVDFFTCGRSCDPITFSSAMIYALRPKKVYDFIIERGDWIDNERIAFLYEIAGNEITPKVDISLIGERGLGGFFSFLANPPKRRPFENK